MAARWPREGIEIPVVVADLTAFFAAGGVVGPQQLVGERLAVALTVTIDDLAFGDDRGPADDLRLHLEAASRLDPDEQHVVRSVIEALSVKHEARRWNDTTPAR
jgi:hypothetical protein